MTLIVLPTCRAMFVHTPRWSRNFLKMLSCFCRVTWKSKILSIFHKKILHKTMCSRIFLWKNIQNFRFSSQSTKKTHFQIISRPPTVGFKLLGSDLKKKVQFCFKNEKMWFYGRISCSKHPRSVPDPFRDSYSTQNQKITIFLGFLNFALKFLYIS